MTMRIDESQAIPAAKKRLFEELQAGANRPLHDESRLVQGFAADVENQYFDACVVFGPDEAFVDGGGFKGETALRFARRCPAHRAIYSSGFQNTVAITPPPTGLSGAPTTSNARLFGAGTTSSRSDLAAAE